MLSTVAVEVWIIVSACLVAGGWILSLFGSLNAVGYTVLVGLTVLLCARVCRWRVRQQGIIPRPRRFRRLLPLSFLVLAGCAFAGGIIYAPSNWDALTYRVPRVLNWLSAEHWHWIRTMTGRVNVQGTGYEWLMAPLIVFTKSDRLLFLISFISFLLLPGLIFSVFTRIGVRARVAWYWMWLLPGGYCFALQAGSIANDAFSAIYALAAVDYALRAQSSGQFRDLAFSTLAAGLLTAGKATNLPLVLPWLVAVSPVLAHWIRRNPVACAGLGAAAALVSFLPTAVLNRQHCGDWLGLSAIINTTANVVAKHPVVGLAGNGYQLLVHNLVPPLFPFAGWYRSHAPEFFSESVLRALKENLYYSEFFRMWELPGEDFSGIGFGPTVLILLAFGAILLRRRGWRVNRSSLMGPWRQAAFCAGSLLAVAAVMARSGYPCQRLIAPFYPFLFGSALLFLGHSEVVRQRWWSGITALIMMLAVLVMLVTPSRPLFPAQTLIGWANQHWPNKPFLTHATRVYTVYGNRSDALKQVRDALPRDAKIIGLAPSGNDMEVSLWRPFSERRVVHVLPGDKREKFEQLPMDFVVISDQALQAAHKLDIQEWCKQFGAHLVAEFTLPTAVSKCDEKWYITRVSSQSGMVRAGPTRWSVGRSNDYRASR